MVRDIMGLMEILSFLYAFAATYRAKVKCNIYTVVFAISQLIILSGMNNHGMTEYLLGLSYVLMKSNIVTSPASANAICAG